jgi:NADPH:quinone reductase
LLLKNTSTEYRLRGHKLKGGKLNMKAVQLTGFNGFDSLQVVEAEKPAPQAHELLMKVEAAGVNFAELEMTQGKYPAPKKPPFVMGFEAAGTVIEAGARTSGVKVGDRITAIVSGGGYAEYAVADASRALPIPEEVSFAQATTIPIQGVTAYALLKFAAKLEAGESLLIQAAAGGVGLFLVQLAKLLGSRKVVALAGSKEKVELVRQLGADVAVDYSRRGWPDQVLQATDGKGVDIVLEAAAGEIGQQSSRLVAPFGRLVLFGARNIHESFAPDRIRQLIYKNQSVIGFNLPTMRPELLAECAQNLMQLIAQRTLQLFANHTYPLEQVKQAFDVFASRQTIGKVVLVP